MIDLVDLTLTIRKRMVDLFGEPLGVLPAFYAPEEVTFSRVWPVFVLERMKADPAEIVLEEAIALMVRGLRARVPYVEVQPPAFYISGGLDHPDLCFTATIRQPRNVVLEARA